MKSFFTGEQLQNILDLIPAIIYWESIEGQILGCNNQLIEVFGKKYLKDMIGKTSFELLDDSKQHLAHAFRKTDLYVMENREVVLIEEIGPNAQGYETRYLSKKAPLIGTRNQICGILGVSIDLEDVSNFDRRNILDKCFNLFPGVQ